MRNTLHLLGISLVLALLGVGCAGPEQKLGRGVSNMGEFVRQSEFQRSVEQSGLFYGTDVGITTGIVAGVDHTLLRTGMGVYEVVTFPFPPYRPLCTDTVPARALYPDSYQPHKWSDVVFDNDRYTGFSGGDVAPWFPGSRFRVFDN